MILFSEGMQISNPISVDQVAGLVEENQDVLLLDVRYPYEFSGGHIIGAHNHPSRSSLAEYQIKTPHKIPVIVYCEFSSIRAPQCAKNILGGGVFVNVYVMTGGYNAFVQKYPQFCKADDIYNLYRRQHIAPETMPRLREQFDEYQKLEAVYQKKYPMNQ